MNDPERRGLLTIGFALGAIAGGAAVAILATDERKHVAKRVREKLEEWTTGRSLEEVSSTVRDQVNQIAEEVTKANQLDDCDQPPALGDKRGL